MNQDTPGSRKSNIKQSQNRSDCNVSETKLRLVVAVLACWSDSPRDAVSVRTITARAGLTASSVDYHFGKVEHLYGAAQDYALGLAQHWTDERIEQVHALQRQDLGLAARAAIVGGIIDDWAQGQRHLAMAAREASAAARGGGDCLPHRRWTDLWLAFWHDMAAALGISDAGTTLAMFHDGVGTQHLLCWNRTLDLALLHEDVATLLAFCDDGEMAPDPVRSAFRRAVDAAHGGLAAASRAEPDALDRAAAAVMQDHGIAALTFRNVAARAGETLGRTAWHFGTKTALLERAFEQLYRDAAGLPPPVGGVAKEDMLAQVIAAVTGGSQPILRAFDEIILHIARSPDHVPLRGAIRAYRDPAATWVLEGLLADSGPVALSLASVFSSICRGLDHYSLAHAEKPGESDQRDRHYPAPAAMAELVLRRFVRL